MKRIVSILVMIALIVGMIPSFVFADEVANLADNNDISFTGTNALGDLLSDGIENAQNNQNQAVQPYVDGYFISGIIVEGQNAYVSYGALDSAMLVVALYTEDGKQMLTSANVEVDPELTDAILTFEGEMPEYFMASAYLLDTYDLVPLCADFETPMYTKAMQDLLASTVHDYDADRVLNMDENENTNFAVYADDTIVIESIDDKNIVSSVDNDKKVYVIENADEQITSLSVGDIFVYEYTSDDMLIVKVKSIVIEGDTVTVTGDDVTTTEVFSHLKIEGQGDTDDVVLDTSNAEEGVDITVSEEEIAPFSDTRSLEDGQLKKSLKLQYEAVKIGDDDKEVNITIAGNFTVTVTAGYYVAETYEWLDTKFNIDLGVNLSFSGAISGKIPLGKIIYPIIPAILDVNIDVDFVMEFECELSFYYGLKTEVGLIIAYGDQGWDSQTYHEKPETEFNAEVEGKVFVGFEFTPKIEVAKGIVMSVSAKARVGGEASLTLDILPDKSDDIKHDCVTCAAGEMNFVFSMSFTAKLFKSEKLSYTNTFLDVSYKLFDFYWCADHDEFSFGKCPYLSYKLTVKVVNDSEEPVSFAEVVAGDKKTITDKDGIAVLYFPAGTKVYFYINSDSDREYTVKMDGAKEIKINFDDDTPNGTVIGGGLGSVDFESIKDHGAVVASGECGEVMISPEGEVWGDKSDVVWTLYESGLLEIKSIQYQGFIEEWSEIAERPWHQYIDDIKYVIVYEEVSNIPAYAFKGCSNLSNVNIRGVTYDNDWTLGVQRIGESAFEDCFALQKVELPESVNIIGSAAFKNCVNLKAIKLPESVESKIFDYGENDESRFDYVYTVNVMDSVFYGCENLTDVRLPDGIAYISDSLFYGCSNLTNVYIPDSVRFIESKAFYECKSLKSVDLPETIVDGTMGSSTFQGCSSLKSVTLPKNFGTKYVVGNYIFAGCTSLTNVTIPEGVGQIGAYMFEGCTSLTDITIPGTVKSVYENAFRECTGLKKASILDGVTEIGSSMFLGCTSLSEVTLPDTVTEVSSNAFLGCTSLTSITIPSSVVDTGSGTFVGCTALEEVIIEEGVDIIGWSCFQNCTALTRIKIPNTVTLIGNSAFSWCTALENIEIPDSVTRIGWYAFENCSSLKSIVIPNGVTEIEFDVFTQCTSLESIVIPASVKEMHSFAFKGCHNSLKTVKFYGDVPIGWYQSIYCYSYEGEYNEVTIYYPKGNSTWESEIARAYFEFDIKWVPFNPALEEYDLVNDTAMFSMARSIDSYDSVTVSESSDKSLYKGVYDTVIVDGQTIKTASFDELVPGVSYVLLALANLDSENVLDPENLLYIDQGIADENGNLSFTYIPRISTDLSYVFVCGKDHKVEDENNESNEEETSKINPFTDVKPGKWYTEGILYCYYNGYMAGVSETVFDYKATMNRQMFATILAKIDGADVSGYTQMSFSDVKADQWYSNSIEWAYQNGYAAGVGAGIYGRKDPVTREQIAMFFYTYSEKNGIDVSGRSDITGYDDYDRIHGYALNALSWAVNIGLISGTSETTLSPRNSATRSEVALIIMNYVENVKK